MPVSKGGLPKQDEKRAGTADAQPVARLETIIKSAMAVLAFFPGIAVFLELVEVPPDFIGAAKIISVSISILVVLCIPLFSERIMALGKKTVAVMALIAVCLGAASLIFYGSFARSHVVSDYGAVPESGPAGTEPPAPKRIIPLRASDEIVETLRPFAGEHLKESYELALEGLPQREADLLRTRMAEQSMGSFAVMVILLLLAQVLLVAPPLVAAWRVVTPERRSPERRRTKPGHPAAARRPKGEGGG